MFLPVPRERQLPDQPWHFLTSAASSLGALLPLQVPVFQSGDDPLVMWGGAHPALGRLLRLSRGWAKKVRCSLASDFLLMAADFCYRI